MGWATPKMTYEKKIWPITFFLNFFFAKLRKYNNRKTKKWGEPPQKLLIKKISPPKSFLQKYFCSQNFIKIMIEKPKKWGEPPQKLLLKKIWPPNFFEKIFFFAKLHKYNALKTKNGVSHPKNDWLKKMTPQIFFEKIFFFFKLHKYNDRKTKK